MSASLFEEAVLPHYEAHRAEWLTRARSVARLLGQGGAAVTINDVRRRCPPPEGFDPRVMGAVFLSRDWEQVRHIGSSRRECHGRPICEFRLKGTGA